MKFFKYPFYLNIVNRRSKIKNSNSSKQDRRNARINDIFSSICIIILLSLFACFAYLTIFVGKSIDHPFLKVLAILGMIIVTIFVPLLITACIVFLLEKILPSYKIAKFDSKDIGKVTEPLKKYYKVNEQNVVTKCYECSNKKFANKDVMMFTYQGKIRIILDFNHTIKDYGCYELKLDEIKFAKKNDDGIIKVELQCKKVSFVFGERALIFLKNVSEENF